MRTHIRERQRYIPAAIKAGAKVRQQIWAKKGFILNGSMYDNTRPTYPMISAVHRLASAGLQNDGDKPAVPSTRATAKVHVRYQTPWTRWSMSERPNNANKRVFSGREGR
jgi:hypothetical protein